MKRLSIKLLAWLTLTSISGLCVIAASTFLYLSPSLPAVDTLKDAHLQTPLRVYSSDSKLIAEFGEKRRKPIRFDNVPEDMVHAFMAAEDDRFYSHPGVDPIGLIRAAIQLVTTGRIQSGGSTITMQVAKNFFLSHERIFSRKFNEILLALQIEQELSKNEIFELYLNKIYLGNRAYGIGAAAQVYYEKPIDMLTLDQIAMIAGLPKAPSRYNPINDPDRALIRRDWILGRMKELGYISEKNYENAVFQPITAKYHNTRIDLQAPYVAEMVRQEMVERFGANAYTEGFRVYTSIQSDLQEAANTSVGNGLMAYNERHGYIGPISNLNAQGATTEHDWQEILNKTSSVSILHPAVVTDIEEQKVSIMLKNNNLGQIEWDNLNWAKKFINTNAFGFPPTNASKILKTGDLIWVRERPDGRHRLAQEPTAQSSLISINPNDGSILALVGGFSFYDSMYNRATQAIRQAGSAFKPFIYAAALANGMTAATIINDAPIVFNNDTMEDAWRPNNDNMRFNGPMRLREGLYRSRNLISIRVLLQTGISKTIDYLTSLGFPEETLTKNLSLALGNVSMTPINIAKGYASIANGGYQVQPYLIERIELMGDTVFTSNPETACRNCDPENKRLNHLPQPPIAYHDEKPSLDTPPQSFNPNTEALSTTAHQAKQVMDPRINYIVNDILNDVIWKGTGRRAQKLKRHDIGGKTGTTNENKDAWFVGFNPDILAIVWVGMDNYSTLGSWEYGANTALPIWLEYMQTALNDIPERKLPQPEGLATLKINPKTGNPARQGDDDAIFEIFRKELAPKATNEESEPTLDNIEQLPSPKELF
ncbi:MAG: penicillin-binding protein 1A [Candidatus Endonucleobacter bathymodioli]|uniref:Penicillin-binding protein 1A n=1 Tax=Candidatus Endonucleibacter bathymodioli TaxID=539814 RepID=A0AA90SSC7_9GAMM|nr:penicillin-binding protein 1A [Candidatus Endonucleobacter bathymodioli]